MQWKEWMRRTIGGGSSNIGAGSGDVDPSWIPNGDGVTNDPTEP